MPKPFDATTKTLVENYPQDWIACLNLPMGAVSVTDADLTTEADRVLRVEAALPYIAHIEFQSGDTTGLPERVLRYNVLLREKHGLPVESAVVLLRLATREAEMSGYLALRGASGQTTIEFRYHVLRVWEEPAERFLSGGIGVLPLALIADVAVPDTAEVMVVVGARVEAEVAPDQERVFWASAFIVAGLKYPAEFVSRLFQGVTRMKESSTYQAILREGRAEGLAEGRAEGLVEGRADGERRLL